LVPVRISTQAVRDHAAGRQCGHIVVALSAAACDDDLIDLACLGPYTTPQAQSTRVIHAIYGIEVPRSHPVDDDLPEEHHAAAVVLAHAQELARCHHIQIESELIQTRDWGGALVDLVDHLGAELLIIGAPAPRETDPFAGWEEDIAGDRASEAADYALKHATCEVWIERIR
jgi:hypothetical protein